MILTGSEIKKKVEQGEIIIKPFDSKRLNPNSYNFQLDNNILVYKNKILDTKSENPTVNIKINKKDGIILYPNKIYLGNTKEIMGSNKYVPIIRGRSSIGRLGLFINMTADLIDIGSINQWTLQLHAVQPLKIYPGIKIGQVTFWKPKGKITLYNGKYKNSFGPKSSLIYKDFV